MFVMSPSLSHCKNKTSNETALIESRTNAQWPAKGFALQIPNLLALTSCGGKIIFLIALKFLF